MSDSFRFFVGIDLGSASHQVCVLDLSGQTLGKRAVAHCGADVAALFDWLATLTQAADPACIAVAAEMPHGAMVEAFLERGYAVFSINPKQLDRFRDRFSVAGAKDDPRDALVQAHALRTDRYAFRRLLLGDPRLLRLRELARAEESLSQDLRRAANQLWQLLQRYFPAVLALVPAADEAWLWDLLEFAPLPQKAARLRPATLQRLLHKHRIRRVSAQQLAELLAQPPLPLSPGAAAAIAEQVLLLLPRLRLLHQQHVQLGQRIERLLEELSGDETFREHRDVQILRSVPGVGRVFTATVLGEAVGPLAQRDYHVFRALAGVAPVTKQSGKTKLVSLRRACHPRLRHVVYHSAASYSQHDPRAHQHYARLRARGYSHARAVRGVADRFLALIFGSGPELADRWRSWRPVELPTELTSLGGSHEGTPPQCPY
ncbi:MAG: IS110 family transposase [Acidobacteria bacterium]|nr:IS110 family transposase [Acidobacteriota bacterium]